jgi:hypothetical protein
MKNSLASSKQQLTNSLPSIKQAYSSTKEVLKQESVH